MDKLEEEYCRMNGWEKKKGIMIEVDMIDDYDKFFIPEDCKDDYYKEGEFWCDKEANDEGVYDDYDIVEHIEDNAELSFKEWKCRKERQYD